MPYVLVVGQSEMESGELGLKDMASGQQESLTVEAVIARLVG